MESQDSPLEKIYVSYSSKDKQALDSLNIAAGLMNQSDKLSELVSSNHDLDPGESISQFMAKLCTHPMLVINLSLNYLQSPYCLFELFYIDWYLERNHFATGPIVWLVGDDNHNLGQLNHSVIESSLAGEEGTSVVAAIELMVKNGELLGVEVGDIPERLKKAFNTRLYPVMDVLRKKKPSNSTEEEEKTLEEKRVITGEEVLKKCLKSAEESFESERIDLLKGVNESFREWFMGLEAEIRTDNMETYITKSEESDQIAIGYNVAVFFYDLVEWLKKLPTDYFQNALKRQRFFEKLDAVVGWHFLLTVEQKWWRKNRHKFHSLRQTVPAYPATDRNRFITDATFSLSTLTPVKLETDEHHNVLQRDIGSVASHMVSTYGKEFDLDIGNLETSGEAWVEFFLQILAADLTSSPKPFYAERNYSSHTNKIKSLIEEVVAQVNNQWNHSNKRTYYMLPQTHYERINTECLSNSKTLLQLLDEDTKGHLCFVQWEPTDKKDAVEHDFVSDVITSLGSYALAKARIVKAASL